MLKVGDIVRCSTKKPILVCEVLAIGKENAILEVVDSLPRAWVKMEIMREIKSLTPCDRNYIKKLSEKEKLKNKQHILKMLYDMKKSPQNED